MKQRITIDQLNELSEKGKERLLEWGMDKERFLYNKFIGQPYYDKKLKTWVAEDKFEPIPLNIGQMIEFLDGFSDISSSDLLTWEAKRDSDWLCNALLEAVKEVLEQ